MKPAVTGHPEDIGLSAWRQFKPTKTFQLISSHTWGFSRVFYKIHVTLNLPCHLFKVCDSAAFSVFMVGCDHHHSSSPPQKNPAPLKRWALTSPSPAPGNRSSARASRGFALGDISINDRRAVCARLLSLGITFQGPHVAWQTPTLRAAHGGQCSSLRPPALRPSVPSSTDAWVFQLRSA